MTTQLTSTAPRWLHPFYPILPNADWVERLVPRGVKLVQLRLKDADDSEIRRQIERCKAVCATARCQLIVNDFWRQAIELGADFIHLGQEDLAAADLEAIKRAGLKLGVSTHDHDELAIALTAEPDYVALGPVYETTLKIMKWSPQGLDRVGEWRRSISGQPLVAIGGITVERATAVYQAGAQSIAVVSDIVKQAQPEARVDQWLAWSEQVQT